VFLKEIVVLGNGVYDQETDDILSRWGSDFTTHETQISFMKLEDLEQELLDESVRIIMILTSRMPLPDIRRWYRPM